MVEPSNAAGEQQPSPPDPGSEGEGGVLVELICSKCQLSFSNKKSLVIHSEKFCDRMKDIIANKGNSLQGEGDQANGLKSYMTFEEVKNYLANQHNDDEESRTTGLLSLEDLRKSLQNNDVEMHNSRAHLHKKRAVQMAEELKQLKLKQQQARAKKLQDHAELKELMQAELIEKEKEIKAGLEREKIARELRKVKESRLGELQGKKTKKLALLEQEKEALRRKEQELLDQIKTIEDSIIKRDTELQNEAADLREKLKDSETNQGLDNQEKLKQQYVEIASQYGARVARMEQEKAKLVAEQDKTVADLKNIVERTAKGNPGKSSTDETDTLTAMIEELTTEKGILEQENRLRELKLGTNVKEETADIPLNAISHETHRDESPRLRDEEMMALSSEKPVRLPLAQDAERLLDQWLKSENETSSTSTPLGSLLKDMITRPASMPLPVPSSLSEVLRRQYPQLPLQDANRVSEERQGAINHTEFKGDGAGTFDSPPILRTLPRSPLNHQRAGDTSNQDWKSVEGTQQGFFRDSDGEVKRSARRSPPQPVTEDRRQLYPPSPSSPTVRDIPNPQSPVAPRRMGANLDRPVQDMQGESGRYLKDLDTLRQRYMQMGGNNGAILHKIHEMEQEVKKREEINGSDAPFGNHHQVPFPGAGAGGGGFGPYGSLFLPMSANQSQPYSEYPYNNRPAPFSTYASGPFSVPPSALPPPHTMLHPQQQLQQQFLLQTYQQLANVEVENARLQEEMDYLNSAGSLPSRSGDGSEDSESPRLQNKGPPGSRSKKAADDLFKTVSALPPDHKLHKLWELHVEEITSLQLEIEKMQKLSQLESMKDQLMKAREAQVKEQQHKERLEEQRRLAQLVKLQKKLGTPADALSNLETTAQAQPVPPYDPATGMTFYFDFVMGFADKLATGAEVKKARVIYGLYEGVKPFGAPKSSEWLDCRRVSKSEETAATSSSSANASTMCIFSLRLHLPDISTNGSLSLITEVHLGDENVATLKQPKFQGGGWGYLHLFHSAESELNHGFHKLALYAGSFSPTAFDAALKIDGGQSVSQQLTKKLQRNGGMLHLRIMNGEDSPGDFTLDHPERQAEIYLTPRALTPKAGKEHISRSHSDVKSLALPSARETPRRPSAFNTSPVIIPKTAAVATGTPRGGGDILANSSAPGSAANTARVAAAPSHPANQSSAEPHQLVKPSPLLALSAANEAVSRKPSKSLMDKMFPTVAIPSPSPQQQQQQSQEKNVASETTPPERLSSKAQLERKSSAPPASVRRPSLIRRGSSLRRSGSKLEAAGQQGAATGEENVRNPLQKRDSIFLNGTGLLGGADNEIESNNAGDNEEEGNKNSSQSPNKPVDDTKASFIENLIPGGDRNIKRRRFRQGDGFTICVDGARGLPDNASISKITLRVLTADNKQVGNESVGLSSVEGLRASPEYRVAAEFVNIDNFDPTSTIIIRVDAIDRWSKNVCCIGYAVLNVLCSSNDVTKQPTSLDDQDFQLNLGAFQLSLHQGPPNMKVAFNASSLSAIKKVPCSTLLVRIVDREDSRPLQRRGKPTNGLSSLAIPSYGQGLYDSSRCLPTEYEELIYERRTSKDSGHNQPLRATIVGTFLNDGPPPDASQETIGNWMASKLNTKPTELLDLNCLVRYQPDLGFKVTLDSLYNMPSPGLFQTPKLYKMIFLLSPPALYFNDPPLTDDAHITKDYDLGSSALQPAFLDSTHVFRDVLPDSSTVLLVEIRGIKQDKGLVVESAYEGYWTALPVFRDRGYINNGDFQVPLFKGSIPSFVIGAPDVYSCITSELKKNASAKKSISKQIQLSDGASLSLRLTDILIDDFIEPLPHTQAKNPVEKRKNVSYLNAACEAANVNHFVFDAREPATDKTIQKLIPKKREAEDFLKEVNIRLTEATKITHYTF